MRTACSQSPSRSRAASLTPAPCGASSSPSSGRCPLTSASRRALQFRVGVVGYQAVGQRPRAEERNRRDAGFVQAGKEACQLMVGALDRVAKFIPRRQQAAAKRSEVGGRLDESVGLVL